MTWLNQPVKLALIPHLYTKSKNLKSSDSSDSCKQVTTETTVS